MVLFSDNILLGLKPAARAYKAGDPQNPGLYLEVLPSGLKRWRLRREIGGRRRQVTLGALPGLSLAEARKLAEGSGDSKGTFGELCRAWLAAMGPSVSRLSADILERAVLPVLGALEPGKITGSDILIKIIRPLCEAGDVEGAERARRALERLFLFGMAAGLVFGNPAEGLPELAHPTVTGRMTPVIDPMAQGAASPPHGQAIEARPHHYAVKRNPKLAGLIYDPSHPGPGQAKGGSY